MNTGVYVAGFGFLFASFFLGVIVSELPSVKQMIRKYKKKRRKALAMKISERIGPLVNPKRVSIPLYKRTDGTKSFEGIVGIPDEVLELITAFQYVRLYDMRVEQIIISSSSEVTFDIRDEKSQNPDRVYMLMQIKPNQYVIASLLRSFCDATVPNKGDAVKSFMSVYFDNTNSNQTPTYKFV